MSDSPRDGQTEKSTSFRVSVKAMEESVTADDQSKKQSKEFGREEKIWSIESCMC